MKKNIDVVRDYLDGVRPVIQVGYTGEDDKYVVRKIGDTWTDSDGKEWKQTASGPQTVNRILDIVRAEMNLTCSRCNCEIRWRSDNEQKIHAKTGMCMDCLIEEETKLRISGQWKNYEKKKILQNELPHYKDLKKHLEDSKTYLEEHKVFTFVNSNGLVEEWGDDAADDVRKSLKKDYTRCLKEIKRAEKELKQVEADMAKASPPTPNETTRPNSTQ